ncbi:MAG: hypothetical protein ABIZ56_01885 [Chthoniobacteraceae bacterium]
MKVELYSSVPQADAPNLVSLQDERLDFLPTVLVSPLRRVAERTAFRVLVEWRGATYIVCPELTRPIRRTALRLMGQLDPTTSRAIMDHFQHLFAR